MSAFFGALQYGSVEYANSSTQTVTIGYYDLEESAELTAAYNLTSDKTRRQTKIAVVVSANAALGTATADTAGMAGNSWA